MADNQLIFRSFASGSSGNCYFLGTSTWGILIDAGISARTIQKNLREMGLDYANIMGVLITHDHADHIRAVGTLGERVHLPIYSTRDIHDGIDRNYTTVLIATTAFARSYVPLNDTSRKAPNGNSMA